MTTNFEFNKTGLTVELTTLLDTIGEPVSFLWVFGDNTQNDTTKDVSHTYLKTGFYLVELTVTYLVSNEQVAVKVSKQIGVSDVNFNVIDQKIEDLIGVYLPTNIPSESLVNIPILIQKWQLFLQPLVDILIEDNKVLNQLYWPPLVNYLIAQLVAYDLIVIAANQYLIGIGTSSGSDSTGSTGEVKRVQTGPAEVEWFQGSETWSEVFKQGGTFEELTNQICSLSSRLRITLSMCPKLSHSPIIPRVYKNKRR